MMDLHTHHQDDPKSSGSEKVIDKDSDKEDEFEATKIEKGRVNPDQVLKITYMEEERQKYGSGIKSMAIEASLIYSMEQKRKNSMMG